MEDKKRMRLYSIVIFSFASIIILKLFYLQIIKHDYFLHQALIQYKSAIKLTNPRGEIRDRNNTPIGASIPAISVVAYRDKIKNPRRVARLLSGPLGMKEEEILSALHQEGECIFLKRRMLFFDAEGVEKAVKEINSGKRWPWLEIKMESGRYYPKGSLASNLIGFVGTDRGLSGLESKYEDILSGGEETFVIYRDASRRYQLMPIRSMTKENHGTSLILTIDEDIQFAAERALKEGIEASAAKDGVVIVMNPNNGDIYAMASYPDFDPNHYELYDKKNWVDRVVQDTFEPGSTFKIFTAACALEDKYASTDETIFCGNGSITIGNTTIHDHDPYGYLSFADVVAKSSNVGAIRIGMRLDKQSFYKFLTNFGFGSQTGLSLPGEQKGILAPTSQWSSLSLASISMGQEISVTPIQLACAVSAIANGGIKVEPRIIDYTEKTEKIKNPYKKGDRILSKETADKMKEILTRVVTDGTGKKAGIMGYSVAGKTGTSQKAIKGIGYTHDLHVAIFVGFVPVENPKILVVAILDEPRGLYYGGQVAAPVFANTAQFSLKRLEILPSKTLMANKSTGVSGED